MLGSNSQWAETFQAIEYASLIQILFHMDSHNTIPEKKMLLYVQQSSFMREQKNLYNLKLYYISKLQSPELLFYHSFFTAI